jgi:hypothetical protein
MTSPAKSALANHRARMARLGLVRVEVNVSKDDANLIREVATALSDPARQTATRMLIRQRVTQTNETNLKTLLASAPLNGIDLTRDPDLGLDIDL